MEIKLFGKTLFSARKEVKAEFIEELVKSSNDAQKGSKFLPDFYKGAGGGNFDSAIAEYVIMPVQGSQNTFTAIPKGQVTKKGKKAKKVQVKQNIKLTPKGVFELKMLNDDAFQLNTNPDYIEKQVAAFKDKLALVAAEEYDMRNGVGEINSVLVRMENRKKYAEFKDFYEEFPYTTTTKVVEMSKVHTHLKLGQIAQFVADMPPEATDVMKRYNEYTEKLCGKQAVFYIIADEKDFKKTTQRRDPILLAQSPFGHVWQILGAWDKEMLLIEEL